MADMFKNYQELSQVYTEGTDYKITYAKNSTEIGVISIHGGGIEVGTTELLESIKSRRPAWSWYSFEALLASNNGNLHITSTNFDEPRAINLVNSLSRDVSLHGASGDTPITYIGGLDQVMRDFIWEALEKRGFAVQLADGGIAGKEPNNIINRASHGGVQLEMTTQQRKEFFTNDDWSKSNRTNPANWTQKMKDYTDAVIEGVERALALKLLASGQLSLTDLNDAIIAGTAPANPTVGTLWIDSSVEPAMLKKWNGTTWDDMGELDPNLSETITDIQETLGNMANDGILNFQERQVIKDKLTEIIGYVPYDKTPFLSNYKNKTSGANGGNSHIAKYYSGVANPNPTTAGAEFAQSSYDAIKTLNNTTSQMGTMSTSGYLGYQIYGFNLIRIVEDQFGKIPEGTTADKVAWLKSNINNLKLNWTGRGSSPTGNKASIANWRVDVGAWGTASTHTSGALSTISSTVDSSVMQYRIDSNGFTWFGAWADASDGTTASTILTDYVEVEVTMKDPLPTSATLDGLGYGDFYNVRRSAILSGISATDSKYITVATAYTALKSYLDGLTPVDPWDTTDTNKDEVISVDKTAFRDTWLNYYTAVSDLATATSDQLKQNVDNVVVGGTNWASNGDFRIDITKSLWKTAYVGNTVEVVDISTEKPPFMKALHIKNTSATNGGIFTPVIWDGDIAGNLVDKEIMISFWLKYQNITMGTSDWMKGRFGEIIIQGQKADGTYVYSYPQATNGYITGTDMTWKKWEGKIKLTLPTGATKITRISFKHGIENCTGEFWTTGIKIENGNKATDWSPCPLDLEDRISKAEFKVTDDQIVATVTGSSTYQATLNTINTNISNVDKKIDGVSIGGRNLIFNSTFKKDWKYWTGVSGSYSIIDPESDKPFSKIAKVSATGLTGDSIKSAYGNLFTAKKGDVITVSMDIKVSDANAYDIKKPFIFELMDSTGNNRVEYKDISLTDTNVSSLTSGQWTTITYTHTVATSTVAFGRVRLALFRNGTVFYRELKAELANKSSAWTPAPEDIDDQFDNLIIGGRNLLKFSNKKVGWGNRTEIGENYTDANITAQVGIPALTFYNAGGSELTAPSNSFKIESNKEYTLSFWYYNGLNSKGTDFWFMEQTEAQSTGTTYTSATLLMSDAVYSNGTWVKKSVTFRTSNNPTTKYGYIRWDNNGSTSGTSYVYVAGVKLEEGNKASTWTPAPEDVDANIQNTQSQINDMMSDLKVTPIEKSSLKTIWDNIKYEQAQLSVQADALGVSRTAYNTAYNNLNGTSPKIEAEVLANMTTTYTFGSTTLRDTFKTQMNTYNNESQKLRKAITDKVNANAKTAQDTIDKLEIGGANLVDNTRFLKDLSGWKEYGSATITTFSPAGTVSKQNGIRVYAPTATTSSIGVQTPMFPIQANKTYVCSFIARSAFSFETSFDYIYLRSGQGTTIKKLPDFVKNDFPVYDQNDNISRRVSFTFSHTADVADANLLIGIVGTGVDGQGFVIRELQVELGSKPTSWSPSDSEVNGYIAEVETTANKAKSDIADMSSDSKITPIEKVQLKKEWATITAEKTTYYNMGTTFGVTSQRDAYNTSYNALNTLLNGTGGVLTSMTTTSTVNATTFRATFDDYYDKLAVLIKATNEKAKALADGAQEDIDGLNIGGRNYVYDSKSYTTGKLTNISNQTFIDFKRYNTDIWGKEVTISFDYAFSSDAVLTASSWFALQFGEGMAWQPITGNITNSRNGHFTKTFTVNNPTVTTTSELRIRVDYVNGGTLTISNLKIELGNRASDWSPAPEDIERAVYDPYFDKGFSFWSGALEGETVAPLSTSDPTVDIVKEGYSGGNALQVTGTKWIYAKNAIAIDVNKTYKARFRVKQKTDATTGGMQVYAGVVTLDNSFKNITGGQGTHRYFAVSSGGISASKGWVTYEGTITGVGDNANQFRSGTAYVRPMFLVNYNGGNGVALVDMIEFYDVTEAKKAQDTADDLKNNTIPAIATRVSTVENKVTDSAIINTVTTSTKWGDKANTSDVFTKDEIAQMSTSQLLHNTEFATGTDGWSLTTGWSLDTSTRFEGVNSLKVDVSGLTADAWRACYSEYYLPPDGLSLEGRAFTGSFYVYATNLSTDDGSRGWNMEIEWFNSAGTRIGTHSASIKPTAINTWQRFSKTGVAPAGTAKARLRAHPTRNGTFWIAKPMLQIGSVLGAWSPSIDELATDLKSQISQTNGRVDIVVSSDNKIKGEQIASSISATPNAIKIISDNINLTGKVTFDSFANSAKDIVANLGQIINVNPYFIDWSGTFPNGMTGANINTGASMTKVTETGQKGNIVKFATTSAGLNAYLSPSQITNYPFFNYITVTITFKLESGGLDGAGVLFRYNTSSGQSDTYIKLSDLVSSPTLNKWYTVTKTLYRSSAPSGFTGYQVYPMGSWTTFATNASAKVIYFSEVSARPSSDVEILSYQNDGIITDNKSVWDRASAINSNGTVNSSKLTGTISENLLANAGNWNWAKDKIDLWKYSADTTKVNGGVIATNTIFAQSLLLSDWTNLCENPEFETDTAGAFPNGYVPSYESKRGNTRVKDITSFAGGNGSSKALEMDAFNGDTNSIYSTNIIPVTQGQSFFIEGMARYLNTAGSGYGRIGFRRYDATRTALSSWDTVVAWTGTKGVTFSSKNGTYTVPSGCSYIQLWISFSDNKETTNKFYLDNIRVHRMANAELIVDGTITAGHIKSLNGLNVGNGQFTVDANGNVKLGAGAVLEAVQINSSRFESLRGNTFYLGDSGAKIDYSIAGSIQRTRYATNDLTYLAIDDTPVFNFVMNGAFDVTLKPYGSHYGLKLGSPIVKGLVGNDTVQIRNWNDTDYGGLATKDATVTGTLNVWGNQTLQGVTTITGSTGGLMKMVGTADAYIEMFPDGTSAGRKSFFGHETATGNNFVIQSDSDEIILKTNSTRVKVDNGVSRVDFKDQNDNGWADIYVKSSNNQSRRELKKNIEPMTKSALREILKTVVSQYHYKNESDESKKHTGIIVDEAPYDVVDDREEGIDIYASSIYSWKAIQELYEELYGEIHKLQSKIKRLEGRKK
ncbi:poly-gamma-glutamate hydrolase family protein [Priestia megaterium]|uniref:poly-gamma-glutamate hydrolase family protein n=1 Tax=Priestia megaterium TaxID=1404 RepID=UPI000BFD3D52|nr:poly-gamma-glutamate hydrolase family protein [Priestia megaterium]PGO60730.1 hypothetical protein CN981_09335 [Priestia megaterium]